MTCDRCRLREACDWRTRLCSVCLGTAWRNAQRQRETTTSPWVRNAATNSLPPKEYAR